MTPPKTSPKTYNIPSVILGYVKIDNDYGRNMRNFALVDKSWCKPATDLLYTHLNFESYDEMVKYLLMIQRPEYARYASTARTMCLSRLSGPENIESDLCRLIQSCPNIISFKIFKCPRFWVTETALLAMSTHWPRLAQLSLGWRDYYYDREFITAIRRWPGLRHLDLTNVWEIKENQYNQIIRLLPNLRSLRLSREFAKQLFPDPDNVLFRDHISNDVLRAISNTCRFIKVIELNNCTRLSNPSIRNCFRSLANTLECVIITECRNISGITLAEVIAACASLRFVDVSRSSFDNKALRHLSGHSSDASPELIPRIGQHIEQFAMSNCSDISLEEFHQFANVLGSHVRDRHVKKCTLYVRNVTQSPDMYGMTKKLDKYCKREIERLNPGLIIKADSDGFLFDEIIESIVGPVV